MNWLFYHNKIPSLFLAILLVLRSTLSDINITTQLGNTDFIFKCPAIFVGQMFRKSS